MWALLSRGRQIQIVVALTVVIILGYQGLSEWWSGQSPPIYKLFSIIVFIIGAVLTVVANWAWKWVWRCFPILSKVFFPDLNGTWVGNLQTTWKNPETGVIPGPIPSTVTIRQGLFDISIKQVTGESTSHSMRVIADADPNADRYRLWYSYANQPKAEFYQRSTQHEGFAWLEISLADAPDRLTGQYYTSRKTSGDMTLRRVAPQNLSPTRDETSVSIPFDTETRRSDRAL